MPKYFNKVIESLKEMKDSNGEIRLSNQASLVLLCLAFLWWIYHLRIFFTGQVAIVADANSYYEHFKFFIDQLAAGVYPLWDPIRGTGVPNEFFLRRIGSFNPLYLLILILTKCGLSFIHAYLAFLAFYYFLGIMGFYKLAQQFFKDNSFALTAALLLMFSSLISILFRSFAIVLFVPGVWFFYFFSAFFQTPKKHYFAGMTFCSMIILTTYLPFYFLTMLILFLLGLCFFYPSLINEGSRRCLDFVNKNRLLSFVCAICLAISLLPGWQLFQELKGGALVLPGRHYSVESSNALEVASQSVAVGGIPAAAVFEQIFSDWRTLNIGRVYIPLFAYILLLLGMFNTVNRRLLLLAFVGMGIYLISLYDATPIYGFLYRHVFYFKYFRNFQLFLWIVIFPLFILFGVEQLRLFLAQPRDNPKRQYFWLGQVILIHLGVGIYLLARQDTLLSVLISVLLSLIYFITFIIDRPIAKRPWVKISLLVLMIVLPSTDVFRYLSQNAIKLRDYVAAGQYSYDAPYHDFNFLAFTDEYVEQFVARENAQLKSGVVSTNAPWGVYYDTQYYYQLYRHLPLSVLYRYIQHRLVLYDDVQEIDEDDNGYKKIEEAFRNNQNMAFVPRGRLQNPSPAAISPRPMFDAIQENSERLQVASYDVNSLRLKTHFDTPKFLVYNDSFHQKWRASINGQKVKVVRANIAFKGLWVPAGEATVYFRFGSFTDDGFNYVLLLIFYGVGLWLVLLWRKDAQEKTS
jgi:hypothetical protein